MDNYLFKLRYLFWPDTICS